MDQEEVRTAENQQVVALVGHPNSGKTTLFNVLTGLNQRVGNFPGVTVERKSAALKVGKKRYRLIDLPGTNSVYPQAEDEEVTTDILKEVGHPDHPDIVLLIADANQLRRGLMLCMQIQDMGFPVVLAVNMIDQLKSDGSRLDLAKLQNLLEIPVIGVSAKTGEGINELKSSLSKANASRAPFMNLPPGFLRSLDPIKEQLPTQSDYFAYQILLEAHPTQKLSKEDVIKMRDGAKIDEEASRQLISNELLVRLDRAETYMQEVLMPPPNFRERLTERLDYWLTHPILGYVIFLGILLLIFQSIFVWATYPMEWIEAGFGSLQEWVASTLPAHFLTDLLSEGIIAGLGGIIVFIPQIAFLFFFFAILEDSGYMARVVFIMDRIMRPFGFSGRSVIPLMGGMACAIPSIMMTRSIVHRKERLITIMVTPLISCSARIPVYTLLIAMFVPAQKVLGLFDLRGVIMMGMYFLGFILALIVAWVFKKILKHNSNNLFVMELPAYQIPGWKNVGLTVWQKSWTFIREAGQIILAISIILWLLLAYGPSSSMDAIDKQYKAAIAQSDSPELKAELNQKMAAAKLDSSYAGILGRAIEPAIRPLGYDWKIGISLIASFAAREVFVGTMSIIYQRADPEALDGEEEQKRARLSLVETLQQQKDPRTGNPVYTLATVLSLLIFYAISMQCMSTLAVTKKEAGWTWTWVMLIYLTLLAYLLAWGTYNLVNAFF
ncbi:MAG: ferrous iron transport protein B [Bacteroidota bacterium]